tara:strand:+ start:398 stop:1456 length:1059 start_codon:yes stop_codon:yes gene_type:complete
MTKARDLANLISTGNPLSDGAIAASEVSGLATVATSGAVADVTGAAPLASPTFTGNVSLGDNVKLKLGDGEDLEVYHDSTHSIIKDAGTGDLWIAGDNALNVTTADFTEYKARFVKDESVYLFHNNAEKFKTTATGADVTGLLNTDNLTINGAQGTNGQVLSSTGSGVGWADAGGGAWSLLQRNAISSNTSSISYTNSLLTSTYKHYRLIISDAKMSANNQIVLRFLNGSTAITTSYDFIGWRQDPPNTSSFSYQNGLGSSYASLQGNTGSSDYSFSGTVDVILATGNNVPYGRSSLTTSFSSSGNFRAKIAEYAFTNYNNPLSTTMNGFQVKPSSDSQSFTQGTFSLYALS